MTFIDPSTAAHAAASAPTRTALRAGALITAARSLLPALEAGTTITSAMLREAMVAAFGGSDAEGHWLWKDAYDACEIAQIFFLRAFAPALRHAKPGARLTMLQRIAPLLPTHTKRSAESQALQQLSTPLPIAHVAACAAALTDSDTVLEPSAGTGLLAIQAELAGARLILNELSDHRAALLRRIFPDAPVSQHDAAHIHDHLAAALRPTVILMNPPFSAGAHVEGRVADAGVRHIASALGRLAPGGRLVAITGASQSPDNPAFRDEFRALQDKARVVFTAPIDGRLYAKHGTTIDTRLTVIDRIPTDRPDHLPASAEKTTDLAALLASLQASLPPRAQAIASPLKALSTALRPQPRPAAPRPSRPVAAASAQTAEPLAYETCQWTPPSGRGLTDAIYEGYSLQSIRIPGAKPHPTALVQSAAMASVAPPQPSYRPHLPSRLVSEGILSEAQLESVIYAGEAHRGHLTGAWKADATFDTIAAAADDAEGAVRFRRGWFLGDGTGAGKGRQAAGIILDNWMQGRRRAVWISKSDKLIDDAQRDWSALGQERLQITPLARFRQGNGIRLDEGILFTTYATIRTQEREGKASRVQQIVDWLGADFDGVIIFDEAHAMANAAGGKSNRGAVAPSQQGRAGLRLQHALPEARIVYVSATGATEVENLAYAQRLGLWGGEDFPFATRAEFIEAIQAGGVAAMEVLARDLKALGLYAARSLSYEGVQYELVEHQLTGEQIAVYDAYAGAFRVIHNHLDAAMKAAGITSPRGQTMNAQAKAAARSAFESSKQRFFSYLITSMKTPTLIRSVDRDLEDGHAAIIQIVSTGEALMERRLADIPTEDWNDIQVDVTPREYVLDYLMHSFPVQLFEEYSDAEGNLASRPVYQDGNPVLCREAVDRRDELLEHLASLPPVPAALDQILHRFGADKVAEVTGRSRRILRKLGSDGIDRLAVENRAGSANLSEAQAFQNDDKRILVFSDAGGTGRSYHADLGARNQRLRVHYMLEAGWRADTAIQGLGRSNRTNQAQPPLFRPVATNVKGEKRFLSTIARRLDTLGAITKGQRQTGGQGLFRADDNLESHYARDALRQFYMLLFSGRVAACSLSEFQDATGLALTDEGGLRDELPPITTFLNRILALPIALQNAIFEVFEQLLEARIEGAIAAGIYDKGLETITAESMTVASRRPIYTHKTGAETQIFTILRKDRNRPRALADALDMQGARPMRNTRSERCAVLVPAPSLMLDDGAIESRVRLLRPMDQHALPAHMLEQTAWEDTDVATLTAAWQAEIAALPEFSESTLHVATGLLLPIWRRLPDNNCRVYRLETDDGERVIGRLIPPAVLSTLYRNLGLDEVPQLDGGQALPLLIEGKASLQLADGLELRRVRVMADYRIELLGFTSGMRERLKAYGLTHEIISWKLRFFVPMGADAPAILDRLIERHPLVAVVDRAAA